jgi:hypothetical protein
VGSNLPKRFWCRGGFEGIIFLVVFTFFCRLGAICDLGVGTLQGVCNLGGSGIWAGVYPITLGVTSTSTHSWIFGGVAWIWVRTHVWFNLPTLKVVEADDGSWNMFYDDPTWHNEKNHTSIRLHTKMYLQHVHEVLIAKKHITLHHTLCPRYVL